MSVVANFVCASGNALDARAARPRASSAPPAALLEPPSPPPSPVAALESPSPASAAGTFRILIHRPDQPPRIIRQTPLPAVAEAIARALLRECAARGQPRVAVRVEHGAPTSALCFDPLRIVPGECGGWSHVRWTTAGEWCAADAAEQVRLVHPATSAAATQPQAVAPAAFCLEPSPDLLPHSAAAAQPVLSIGASPPAPAAAATLAPALLPIAPVWPGPPGDRFRGYGWPALLGVVAMLTLWFTVWTILVR